MLLVRPTNLPAPSLQNVYRWYTFSIFQVIIGRKPFQGTHITENNPMMTTEGEGTTDITRVADGIDIGDVAELGDGAYHGRIRAWHCLAGVRDESNQNGRCNSPGYCFQYKQMIGLTYLGIKEYKYGE